MPREVLADEAARRARERYTKTEDFTNYWAYEAVYRALEDRLRKAHHRGVVRSDGSDDPVYWRQAALVAAEKLEEIS